MQVESPSCVLGGLVQASPPLEDKRWLNHLVGMSESGKSTQITGVDREERRNLGSIEGRMARDEINPTRVADLSPYHGYIAQLRGLLDPSKMGPEKWKAAAAAALGSEPYTVLRKVIAPTTLKLHGAFFTGSTLSNKLAMCNGFFRSKKAEPWDVCLDPACGGGDLLLSVASSMPVMPSLRETLFSWGQALAGLDIHREFVEITLIRLSILALYRGARVIENEGIDYAKAFPLIKVGNALQDVSIYRCAKRVLLNPPFQAVPVPSSCCWVQRRVRLFFSRLRCVS
jgi:hypothetical protein